MLRKGDFSIPSAKVWNGLVGTYRQHLLLNEHFPLCAWICTWLSYLFHNFDGFYSVLRWWVKQYPVIERLQHRLHGFHWPHQSNQFCCNIIYGPCNRPTKGRCCGGTTWTPAMIRDPWGRWISLKANAAVGRGDSFVMDWISQDYH